MSVTDSPHLAAQPRRRLDSVDHAILAVLRGDGRISIRALAEAVHVSRANAYARLERLRTEGVIRSFTASINPELEGLATSAYVAVNLRQLYWREFADAAPLIPEVRHVAILSGDFDAILLVRTPGDAALRELLFDRIHHLPGVINTRTMLIFEEHTKD